MEINLKTNACNLQDGHSIKNQACNLQQRNKPNQACKLQQRNSSKKSGV
jgi:hypothetical protein